jgi:hypothetical protein
LAQVAWVSILSRVEDPPVFWPLLIFMAEVCSLAGDRARVGCAQQRWDPARVVKTFSIEWYRLKGDLLLALSTDNQSEAEHLYLRAIEIAQEHGVSMLQLRAAISLNRLWRDQGKAEQGRQLLSDAFEKITEGFTTADLMTAQELLRQN